MPAAPETIAAALRLPGLDPVDCRILLQHVLGLEHAQLVAHTERRLGEDQRRELLALAERRRAGEPIAYIVGRREFYGRDFRVDASVLVPRPETELLIDRALERIPSSARLHLLDLGTGSGNIAITLALERPKCEVCAVDASPAALSIARANVVALGAGNVRLLHGRWFEPVAQMRFDMIISNPPYVAQSDPHLGRGDVRYEPRTALCAGPDGLDAIRAIVAHAGCHLRSGGWLLFEHGHDQAEPVDLLLRGAGLESRFMARDLAQLPRVSGGRKPAAGDAPGQTPSAA